MRRPLLPWLSTALLPAVSHLQGARPPVLRRPGLLPALYPSSRRPLVRPPRPTEVVAPARAAVGVAGTHRHVVGPGTECLPSLGAGPPDCTSLRHAPVASLQCARRAPGFARAPAPGDPHLDALVPAGWRLGQRLPRCCLQHHGDNPTPLRLGDRLRCLVPHHSHDRHALSLSSPPLTHPRSSLETVPLCQSPQ
jgi:hypothetical protein